MGGNSAGERTTKYRHSPTNALTTRTDSKRSMNPSDSSLRSSTRTTSWAPGGAVRSCHSNSVSGAASRWKGWVRRQRFETSSVRLRRTAPPRSSWMLRTVDSCSDTQNLETTRLSFPRVATVSSSEIAGRNGASGAGSPPNPCETKPRTRVSALEVRRSNHHTQTTPEIPNTKAVSASPVSTPSSPATTRRAGSSISKSAPTTIAVRGSQRRRLVTESTCCAVSLGCFVSRCTEQRRWRRPLHRRDRTTLLLQPPGVRSAHHASTIPSSARSPERRFSRPRAGSSGRSSPCRTATSQTTPEIPNTKAVSASPVSTPSSPPSTRRAGSSVSKSALTAAIPRARLR